MSLAQFIDYYLATNSLIVLGTAIWFFLSFCSRFVSFLPAHNKQFHIFQGSVFLIALLPAIVHLTAPSWKIILGFIGLEDKANLSDLFIFYSLGYSSIDAEIISNIVNFTKWIKGGIYSFKVFAWQHVLYGFVIAGFLFHIVKMVLHNVRLKNILRDAYHWKQAGRVSVLISEEVTVPFATGILSKRYIVIPTSLLACKVNMRVIVAHEGQHLRNGDVHWELVLALFRATFFWNPAVYFLQKKNMFLRELACDNAVLARNTITLQEYGNCLIAVFEMVLAQRNRKKIMQQALAPCFLNHFRRNAALSLRNRISFLGQEPDKKHEQMRAITLCIILMGALFSFSLLSYDSHKWSVEKSQLATYVNIQNLIKRIDENKYDGKKSLLQ